MRRDIAEALSLLWLISVAVSGCSTRAQIIKEIEEDYCFPLEDDFGGDIQRGRLERLRARGEEGRRALRQVASKEGKDQDCALAYLCILEDPQAVPMALQLLQPDAGVRVQEVALSCLGATRNPKFIDEMEPYLRSPTSTVRQLAVEGLAMIDDVKVRVLLRDLLAHPEYDYSQQIVIRALAQQKDMDAIPVILEEDKRSEANDLVRYEIVAALSTIDAFGTFRDALEVASRIKTKPTRVDAIEAVWNGLQGQLSALPFNRDRDEERAAIERAIEEVKRRHRAER
jgi:HEAT repeat protein